MKLKGFVKNNYSYIVFTLMTTFLVVFFQFLFLNEADDRIYSTVANSSTSDILYFMDYHYNFCNGRTLMHLILIFFLKFDVYLWRIVCPLSFGLLIILTSKFVSSDIKSFKKALFLFSVSVFCVSVTVYESTLFWATGSFNYVFPFIFLMITLLLIKYKKFMYVVPVLGFLCGATTEQCGMISVFCFAMYLFYELFVLKNKLNKTILLTIIMSVGGLLTVVLSPSVIARTYESNSSFIDKLNMIFFSFWFKSEGMVTVMLLLSAVVVLEILTIFKSKNIQLLAFGGCFLMLASFILQFLDIALISVLAQYAFPALLLTGISIICIEFIRQKKNYLPLFSILLGMGAQFMMAVSQRFSFRTTLPSVFCFLFFAVTVLMNNEFIVAKAKKTTFIKALLVLILVLVSTFNIYKYINLSRYQAGLLSEGKYAVSRISEEQTREDIDAIIYECEEVRLNEIEKHKK